MACVFPARPVEILGPAANSVPTSQVRCRAMARLRATATVVFREPLQAIGCCPGTGERAISAFARHERVGSVEQKAQPLWSADSDIRPSDIDLSGLMAPRC